MLMMNKEDSTDCGESRNEEVCVQAHFDLPSEDLVIRTEIGAKVEH
jgi:hypothetical protein